jgi:Kef-type K+ transport system membrane component KefB
MDPYILLLYIAFALLIGFLFGKLAERIRLPEITGYILAGLVIGPNFLGLVDHEALGGLTIITKVVLGIIAYQIGTELWIPKLKKSGLTIVVITVVHSIVTMGLMFLGVYLFTQTLWLALSLSALSIASAPAAIMVIIKKTRAKGPVTETVVPIVGLIDIVAIIVFGLLSSISVGLVNGDTISLMNALWIPLYEVVMSILLGGMGGIILGLVSKIMISKFEKKDQYIAYLAFSVSFILMSVYIAHAYHLSLILMPLALGMAFTNFIGKETFMVQTAALNNFGGPFIILFFTIAGLELSLDVLRQAGLITLIYIVLRFTGKVLGSYIGATIMKSPPVLKKYTGLCLLPQGGVVIGMLIALTAVLPTEEAQLIQAVILGSILFFEVVGPIVFKKSIEAAGESREFEPRVTTEIKSN